MGSLRSTFSNIPRRTKTLVSRCYRGLYEGAKRASTPPVKDWRGPLVRRIETAQTFLTAAEIDDLIGDYLGGASINDLAQRYGIHRATVFAHLRRRNTPRRRLGLDVDEGAEAVRLFRGGVSMREIGRRMGVGRKTVRTALVNAGLIVDSTNSACLSDSPDPI
jgi:DNA-binding CsgD family transcriptional regulator